MRIKPLHYVSDGIQYGHKEIQMTKESLKHVRVGWMYQHKQAGIMAEVAYVSMEKSLICLVRVGDPITSWIELTPRQMRAWLPVSRY
jgi:hypothetical protein